MVFWSTVTLVTHQSNVGLVFHLCVLSPTLFHALWHETLVFRHTVCLVCGASFWLVDLEPLKEEGSADWLGLSSLTFNSPHWHSENCISSRFAEDPSSNRTTLSRPTVNNGPLLIKHPESSQVRARDLVTSFGLPTNIDTFKHKGA